MGSKRTVQIAELPDSGSVRDMHNLTYKILDQYPDAMISYEYDYEPTARYVVIQVDKTALDLQKEELEEKLNSLPYSYSSNEVPSRVVVINQNNTKYGSTFIGKTSNFQFGPQVDDMQNPIEITRNQ